MEKKTVQDYSIETLREGVTCYCRLLGIDKDTCLALILMLHSKELLLAIMKFMAQMEQKRPDGYERDEITTIVVNCAAELREAWDRTHEEENNNNNGKNMVYLSDFYLLTADDEWEFFRKRSRGCYDSFYPFQFFPQHKQLSKISFDDITILCGGNGSGKSTLLNIIAEKLELKRDAPFNKTDFFDPYVERCNYEMAVLDPEEKRNLMQVSRIITSDDVFKHIIGVRDRNEKLSFKRGVIFDEKADMALNGWQGPRSIHFDDPESIKAYMDYYDKFSQPAIKYIRKNIGVDERTYSNGENGFKYFTDNIQPGGLYLLDEPENSLSTEMQLELVQFIQNMARFYQCQFIISSHSPFVLSLPYARIYNMDAVPVTTYKWTDLPNVRAYYDFFKAHGGEFENGN